MQTISRPSTACHLVYATPRGLKRRRSSCQLWSDSQPAPRPRTADGPSWRRGDHPRRRWGLVRAALWPGQALAPALRQLLSTTAARLQVGFVVEAVAQQTQL